MNRTETPFTRVQLYGCGSGVYVEVNAETFTAYGYSLNTGTQLWTKVLPNANSFDSSGSFNSVVANGTLYLWGFGGDIWAINMLTGAILWQTNTNTVFGSSGTNTPYGVWPLMTFNLGNCR